MLHSKVDVAMTHCCRGVCIDDAGGPACRANRLLLRQQIPYLAEEGLWAEAAETVQAGSLLVATPRAAHRNPHYEQLVVLVLKHSKDGTSGVVLNRPSMAVVDDLLGWGCVMSFQLQRQLMHTLWSGCEKTLLAIQDRRQSFLIRRVARRWSPGEGGASLTSVFGSERVYLGGIFTPGACCWPLCIKQHAQPDMLAWTSACSLSGHFLSLWYVPAARIARQPTTFLHGYVRTAVQSLVLVPTPHCFTMLEISHA